MFRQFRSSAEQISFSTSKPGTNITLEPGNMLLNIILDSPSTPDPADSDGADYGSWFKYDQNYLTRITFIPCILTMLASSAVLIILLKRCIRQNMILYYSVLVYAVCQVLLFLAIVMNTALSFWSLASLLYCKMRSCSETFVFILSAYSILGMTAVRFIVIYQPLHYHRILKLRHQTAAVSLKVAFSALIAASPLLGLCGLQVEGEKFCHYQVGELCAVFQFLCSGLGIVLPVVVTIVLYAVIYKSVLQLRASQARYRPSVPHSPEQSNRSSNATEKTWVSGDGSKSFSSHGGSVECCCRRRSSLETFGYYSSPNTSIRSSIINMHNDDAHGTPPIPKMSTSMRKGWITPPSLNVVLETAASKRIPHRTRRSTKASKQVPWSITIALVLYIITTVPWIALTTSPQLWYERVSGQLRLLLDVMSSVMFLGIACSPIAVIALTKALRKALQRCLERNVKCTWLKKSYEKYCKFIDILVK